MNDKILFVSKNGDTVKKYCFLIIILFFSNFLFAKIFELSSSVGIQTGKVEEFVYEKNHTLSRLDWNVDVVPVVSVGGEFNIFHAIIDFSLLSAIPVKVGSMQDYDWQGSDKSKLTNFSDSDLSVSRLFDVEIKAGYEFVFNKFRLLPEIGFCYRNQEFKAEGGYYQYASSGEYWESSLEKKELRGTIISYEQQFCMPFIFFDSEYCFFKDFRLKLNARFYPYIYCASVDSHYLRNYEFFDYMKNGLGFSVGAEIQYKLFALSFGYEYIKLDSGTSKARTIGTNSSVSTLDTDPGTTSSVFSVVFTFRIATPR